MYKVPTGPVGTLHQALRKDLQNIPTPDPTPETAKRMAEVLREIARAMRAAEVPREKSWSLRSYWMSIRSRSSLSRGYSLPVSIETLSS